MTHLNHPTEYNRMMETAIKRASELRGEAINDFWSDAGDAVRQALRSAKRLSHRIARHTRLRRGLEG